MNSVPFTGSPPIPTAVVWPRPTSVVCLTASEVSVPPQKQTLRGSLMTAHRLAYLTALAAVGFVTLVAVLHAAPEGPPSKPAAVEKVEEFEYIVNDTEKKTGIRRVLTLDLGGGVTMDVVHIKAGKLKPIAVSGDARLPALPQVPTFSEAGLPGYGLTSVNGIIAPARTPQQILDRIAKEMATIVTRRKTRAMTP